ncbi:hypothetical protein AB0958_37630 [Streptomyces sp. NPDC006655]|uniref:hypothetical protein n=1 Tax=Streptomyces sp. NPDC006655 TaxID=3156898 RepID=UPI003453ED2B
MPGTLVTGSTGEHGPRWATWPRCATLHNRPTRWGPSPATADDPQILVSGRYWHHRRPREPHRAVHDENFQDTLLASLAAHTGSRIAPR